MSSFFIELSLVMGLVLFISYIMEKIKQPLLIGYILTGLIAGPIFFNILSSNEGYETFSHIGISLLLFIVGLHLNLKLIKEVGVISLVTGIGQVLFTSIIGTVISYALGFSFFSSIVIAIALTFSSTIIIVKLLSDKRDIETLYGKISMGFLIVQDLVAVIILMILSTFLTGDTSNLQALFLKTLAFATLAVFLTYVFSKYILPKFLDSISKSTELMFLFIITWCFGVSSLFQYIGFSLEVGALLAGISLASSPYQFEISSRVRPLRDFFIVMFFILLGSQMVPPIEGIENADFIEKLGLIGTELSPILLPAVLLSLFVLIGNPIIVLLLMTYLGYSSRTGFLAGLTVAQISEFSLILAMLGNQTGFISDSVVVMITFVGIITITGSTYMILNGEKIYNKFSKVLRKLEKKKTKDSIQGIQGKTHEIIIFGYDRIGFSLLRSIDKLKKPYLVIDHDPDIVKKLKSRNINCIYGDASNIEFISEFNLKKIKLFISTIPDFEISLLLLENLRNQNQESTVILTANQIDDALELYKQGADYVILPHFLGGDYVSTLVENYLGNVEHFLREKITHINELKERKDMGIDHPKYNK